ncbi:MAG: succinate dehydrogenase [Proteobacteria bacterium]|nr:succinate dehydrogenase [Pseudomonadota bacterium]MDA1021927.1 succinate dehydrogenase [Pseudomonadota bacterium]
MNADLAYADKMDSRLWLIQRITAVVLAVAVVVHLATIIVAVQGGLSAAEIVSRVGGSLGWAMFYGVFVVAAGLHAPIGLRTILREMTPLSPGATNGLMIAFGTVLMGFGFRAVLAFYEMGGG